LVTAEEGFGNIIQETCPLDNMKLEIIDPSTKKVQEWWEFHGVFLSTDSAGTDFVIVFRNATRHE